MNLYVSSSIGYLREEPNESSRIIGSVSKGESLKYSSYDNEYYYIDNKEGWINTNDVTTVLDNGSTVEFVPNYQDDSEMTYGDYGSASTAVTAESLLSNNFNGIYGMPYQFMDSVDRRLDGTSFGRKYAEKIVSRMPLLFLTPGKQKFMSEYSRNDKANVLQELVDVTGGGEGNGVIDSILGRKDKDGKYYTFEFAYDEYFNYVNPMCRTVAKLLGIQDEVVTIGDYSSKLSNFEWNKVLSSSFKSYFSASENIVFYMDASSAPYSESFSNDTKESALVSTVNGLSDSAQEILFILGEDVGGKGIDKLLDGASNTLSSITSVIENSLNGSHILSSMMDNVTDVLSGGKMIFPELWSNSSFSRSYNIDLKLRSPDRDPLSIYLNIIVPYIHLLAMTAPRQLNANAIQAPFLVRAFYQGSFNVDMGIITDLSVTKGAECGWTDDGLPTQMDISLTIKDLYSSLSISDDDNVHQMVNNTALLDYLCNTAGINLSKPELGRACHIYLMLMGSKMTTMPNRLWSNFSTEISNLLKKLY